MAVKTFHISLPEPLKDYIDQRVIEEHHGTLSDYIRALVRKDQKCRAEERLDKLLLEGLESGQVMSDALREKIHVRTTKAREKKITAL
jgi:antitoxin ParD1/3/4